MKSVSFEIPGKPVGKARPRVVRKRNGTGTIAFTPTETMNYENLVKTTFLSAVGEDWTPIECGIGVEITAMFSYPQSMSQKKRASHLWYTHKPDCDNIVKIICDALNGLAWQDDAQVVAVKVSKQYTDKMPGTAVKIDTLEET